jgi:branched-chain amino acid transport system substrate-binding protein
MRRTLLTVLVALLAAVAGARGAQPAGAQPAPVEIHAFLSITGFNAFIGSAYAQTLKIVEKHVNATGGIRGRPVRFIEHDDQSNPQLDIQLLAPLLGARVPVIIHSGPVASCNALRPLIEPAGPVLYCLTPAFAPPQGSYGFSTWSSSEDGTHALLNYFHAMGWRKLAVITPTEATGQAADRAVQAYLKLPEARDVEIVDYEHFAPADLSVAAQVAKIAAARPQAVMVFGTANPTGTVFRALKDAGLDIPVGAGSGNQTYAEMHEFASFMPRQYYQYSQLWPEYRRLRGGPIKEAMATMYAALAAEGLRPDLGASASWDPALIVVGALRALGPDATAQQMRDYILAIRDYAGANGFYDFRVGNQRGLTIKDCIVVRWDAAADLWQPVSGPAGRLQK